MMNVKRKTTVSFTCCLLLNPGFDFALYDPHCFPSRRF